MSKAIYEIVDNLPTSGITIYALKALSFAVPGEWENLVGFENTIRAVTGETDEEIIQQIGDRAVYLFNDKSEGYQRALWLYQTVDSTDSALATAALANKVGQKIPLLGFLSKLTPKADKLQALDLCLKVVVELVAFCSINGMPGDSIGDFVKSLEDYGSESLMRMAALICLDGLIPLGPDFIKQAQSILEHTSTQELQNNQTFQRISNLIPGGNVGGQLGFIGTSFDSVKGWLTNYADSQGLTREKVTSNLAQFIDVSDNRLDYLAAFLDMSTNYYEHTGTQTLARRLIERAYGEI